MSTEYTDLRANEGSDASSDEDSDAEEREQQLDALIETTFAGLDDSVNSIINASSDSTEEILRKEESNNGFDTEVNPQSCASAMESSIIPVSLESKSIQNAAFSSEENYSSKSSSESAINQMAQDRVLQAKYSELTDKYVEKCRVELQLRKELAECKSYKENYAKLEERVKDMENLEKRFQDLQIQHSKACDKIIKLQEKLEQQEDSAKLLAKSLKQAEDDKNKYAAEYHAYYNLYQQQVDENAKLDHKLITLNTLLEKESSSNNEIRKKLEDAEAAIKPLQDEKESLKEKKNHKEEQYDKIMEKIHRFSQDMNVLEAENAELKSLLELKETEIGEVKEVVAEWKNKYNTVVTEKEEITKNLNVVLEKYNFLRNSGSNHEDFGLKQFLIEKGIHIGDYTKIKNYVLELQRLTAQLETEQDAFRKQLKLKDKEIEEKKKVIEENEEALKNKLEEQNLQYNMILNNVQEELNKRWVEESGRCQAQVDEAKRQCETTSVALRDTLLREKAKDQEITKLKNKVSTLTKENEALDDKLCNALNEKHRLTAQLKNTASHENELKGCFGSDGETELIRLKQEIEILTTENKALRDRIAGALNGKTRLTTRIEKASSCTETALIKHKHELEALTTENETLKRKINDAFNEKNRVIAQLEIAELRENKLKASCQTELTKLKDLVEGLTKENETLKNKVSDALSEKNRIAAQLEKPTSHENEVKAGLASNSQTELTKLKNKVERLTKANETLNRKISDVLNEKDRIAAQLEKASLRENELKAGRASGSQSELTKLKSKVEILTNENENLKSKISVALNEKKRIFAQLEKASSHENELKAGLASSSQAELTKLKNKVESLTKENENLKDKISDTLNEKKCIAAELEKASSRENELNTCLASSNEIQIKLKRGVERLITENETLKKKIDDTLSEKNQVTAELEKAAARENELNTLLASSKAIEKSIRSHMCMYYEKLNLKNKELKAMKMELDAKKTLLLEAELIKEELLKRINVTHPKPISTRTLACQTEKKGIPFRISRNSTESNVSPIPHSSGTSQCCNGSTKRETCRDLPRNQSIQCDMYGGSVVHYIKRDLYEFADQMSKKYETVPNPSSNIRKHPSTSAENTKSFRNQSVQTKGAEQGNDLKQSYAEYAEILKTIAKEITPDTNTVSSGEPCRTLDDTVYDDPDVNAVSINNLIVSLHRLVSVLKRTEMC